MKIIASLIFGLFLAPATLTYGQAWREIKPVESTCKDVERLLGGKACGQSEYKYRLPSGGILLIGLTHDDCDDRGLGRYALPRGTVVYVLAFVNNANLSISDLNIDEAKLERGDAGDMVDIDVLESKEFGVEIVATKNKELVSILYFPSAKYNHLRCQPADKPKPPAGCE